MTGGNAIAQDTGFNATTGSPQYTQMQDLASKYYSEMLEKARATGTEITANMVRRWKQDAQARAVRDLSQ